MNTRKPRPPSVDAVAVPPARDLAARRPRAAAEPTPPPLPVAPPHPKGKLVRDSFTIPKAEYLVLDQLKLRAAKLARPTKKSELIRAGIKALSALGDAALLEALGQVPSLKTGRPQKAPTGRSGV